MNTEISFDKACGNSDENGVGRFVAQGEIVFKKLDNFAMQWLETAKSGLTPISEAMQSAVELVFNLFWAFMALLIMIFTFPLWLLGKVRAQQSITLIGGESTPSQALSTPEANPLAEADTTPPANH